MPKGCMLSHDNLTWENIPFMSALKAGSVDMPQSEHRTVSYLPLSHIAGLAVDFMSPMQSGHKIYFARPDALSGTLVETLNWARPTIFFGVPRVYEKFEEKLKEVAAANKSSILRSIAEWSKRQGAAKVKAAQ